MAYWFTRVASWLAARAPRFARVRVAGALALLVYYAWPAKRRVTIANMAQVLNTRVDDPRAARLAARSWRNYGRYAANFFYLSGRGARGKAEALARTHHVTSPPGTFATIDEARAHGKGVIIVTAHFGSWDAAGMVVASHTPLHVVVERFADPRMDALIQAQRAALGMEVLWMEKSPRQILRVLQQNGVVAIVVDRPLRAGEGTPVNFFGRRCYVPGGVAQLALLSGAAILPGFCRFDEVWSPAYYPAVLRPIYPEVTGDRRADARALTQRIYDALEEIIGPYPDQWYMFRPFWHANDEADGASALDEADAAAVGGAEGRLEGSGRDG
jgi:lauroyl/myristoyl acyltransferase